MTDARNLHDLQSAAMKIATWNVNGIRARHAQVQEWIARERPDVVCLQEIKATSGPGPDRPLSIWRAIGAIGTAARATRASALHVSKTCSRPSVPPFPTRRSISKTALSPSIWPATGAVTVASIYVPNGGKDFPAKMRFLEAMDAYAAAFQSAGRPLVLCGDLNVARTDLDVHPKERKPRAIGQLPEERALLERIIGRGLVDVGRALDPDNDGLFTWWAPWRNMRQRNIGWRLDYVLASARAGRARASSCPVQKDVGTSDHAPVMATFD